MKLIFLIRIDSLNVNGPTTTTTTTILGHSISMNDDPGQNRTKEFDDIENEEKKSRLQKSCSNINEKSKTPTPSTHEHVHKTSSNSNVFSRLMHSERRMCNKFLSTYQQK